MTTTDPSHNPHLVTGLSFAGGGGIILAIIGAAIGVVDPTIDSRLVGALVLAGILMTIAAIIAWAAVVRPFDNFDDINEPLYHGHDHDDHGHDDAEHGEKAAAAH